MTYVGKLRTSSEMLDLEKFTPHAHLRKLLEGSVPPNQRSNPRKNNEKKPENRKSITEERKKDYPE